MGEHPITTTDEEIDAAIERGQSETRHAVVTASYISDRDQIALEFDDGIEVRLPRRLIEGLENANAAQLSHIVIEGPGMGLAWPDLGENVAHYVPNLIDGIFGTRRHMQEIARAGGRAKSPAKTAAVRENGKKGALASECGKERRKSAMRSQLSTISVTEEILHRFRDHIDVAPQELSRALLAA